MFLLFTLLVKCDGSPNKGKAQYTIMMRYQMQPTEIDVVRMANAAICGFTIWEQSQLMTFDRSADTSYEVMLEALLVAIESIRYRPKN